MGLPYLAIPVGSILMFLHLLNEAVLGWRREARFLGPEKGEAEKRLEAGF
jgi:TRAP-type C4-dicarboxylate transport system permease small subunit